MSKLKKTSMEKLGEDRTFDYIKTAFDDFDGIATVQFVPKLEHVQTSRSAACCDHTWTTIWHPEGIENILEKHGETEAELVQGCFKCNATCLREGGRVVSYDSGVVLDEPVRKPRTAKKETV